MKNRPLLPEEWDHIRGLISLEHNYYADKINLAISLGNKKGRTYTYPKDYEHWCNRLDELSALFDHLY